MKRVIASLDSVAEILEKKGLRKFAAEVDVVANSFEEVARRNGTEEDKGK